MRIQAIIAAALAAVVFSGLACAADEPQPGWTDAAVYTSYPSVSGLTRGQCTLVVSDCETCRFEPDGTAMCSTPAFACNPSQWTCMRFSSPGGAEVEHPPP